MNPNIRRPWPSRVAQPGCGTVQRWPQCSAACSIWGATRDLPRATQSAWSRRWTLPVLNASPGLNKLNL